MGVAYERGMLLYNQKRYGMAVDEFQREMSTSPKNPLTMPMLALSLKCDNQFEEAMTTAKAAVAADPERGFCYYALSCVEMGASPAMEAAAIHWDPNGARMLYCERLRTAKLSAWQAVRLSPRNPNFLALMAGIEFDLGMLHEALEWTEKGLAVQADHVRCAQLRARTLARLDRKVEAREAIKRALALAPESASTHSASGWTHLKTGDTQLAVEHFTESLRLDPNDSNVHEGLRVARVVGSRRVQKFGRLGILAVIAVFLAFAGAVNSRPGENGGVPGFTLFLSIIFIAIHIARVVSGKKQKPKT